MQIPLELSMRNVERTPEIETLVERQARRLERYCDSMIGCRVAIERPHAHPESGNPFRVRIDITVPPRHEVVVVKEPGDHRLEDELETVIANTFDAAERRLKEIVDRRAGEVKRRAEPRALVVRKFADRDHGFLHALDGREIYFHRNAVVGGLDFDGLTLGTEVRFEEVEGDEGPQASTVQAVERPGERLGKGGEPVEPPRGRERWFDR
jgi:cold shock CspA family protein